MTGEHNNPDTTFKNCCTLIIGAGIAGVAASINLLKNEYKNFIIIEADSRIGGRCLTLERSRFIFIFNSVCLNQILILFYRNCEFYFTQRWIFYGFWLRRIILN
jgi:heterodisulfide reductase subunit A-like polyferredoxin